MGQEHKQYTWSLIAKKLTGEATPEELRELEELLRQNPELHYPLQTIADLWNPSNPEDQHIAEQAFSHHVDRMQDLKIDYTPSSAAVLTLSVTADDSNIYPFPEKNRRPRRIIGLASAAIIIAAFIITNLYTRRPGDTASPKAPTANPAPTVLAGNEIFTGNGSRTHLTLPDGTVVWLNAGSRINYEKNFGATERAVSLTGEAFFDVAPNAAKPFVIHTASIDIKVLGTSFNVKSYPSDKTTETTLIRGSIEVSIHNRPSDKIVLKPNEKLVVNNEDSTEKEKEIRRPSHPGNNSLVVISKPTYEQRSGAIIETSWIDNKLIFQDEDFGSLAKSMERWYGITIHFDTPEKENLRFTGIFEKETILQAMEALKLTASFTYNIEGNQMTIQ